MSGIIPLIIPLICIIIIAAFYAVIFNRKINETYFLSIATIIFTLYIFGLMNFGGCLLIGYGVIILFSFVALVFLVRTYKQRKALLNDISFVQGLSLLIAFLSFFLFINYGRMFYLWDEFTHWGFVVKHMYIYDALSIYSVSETLLLVPDYIPGTALFQYYIVRPFSEFIEYPLYIGSNLIIFSLIAPFIKRINMRSAVFIGLFTIISVVTISEVYQSRGQILASLYVDTILGILFGCVFLFYFGYKFEESKYGIMIVSAALGLLTMTKDMGLVLAGIAIFIIMFDLLLFRIDSLKEFIKNENGMIGRVVNYALITLPVLTVMIIRFSWQAILSKHVKVTQLSRISDSVQSKSILTDGLLPHQIEIAKSFITAMHSRPLIPLLGLSYFDLSVLLIIIVALVSIIFRKYVLNTYRYVVFFLLLTLGGLAYAGVVYFFYAFTFYDTNPFSALNLQTFGRYMGSYVIGVTLSILLLFNIILDKNMIKTNNINFFAAAWAIWAKVALVILSIVIVYFMFFGNTTIDHNSGGIWKKIHMGDHTNASIITENDGGITLSVDSPMDNFTRIQYDVSKEEANYFNGKYIVLSVDFSIQNLSSGNYRVMIYDQDVEADAYNLKSSGPINIDGTYNIQIALNVRDTDLKQVAIIPGEFSEDTNPGAAAYIDNIKLTSHGYLSRMFNSVYEYFKFSLVGFSAEQTVAIREPYNQAFIWSDDLSDKGNSLYVVTQGEKGYFTNIARYYSYPDLISAKYYSVNYYNYYGDRDRYTKVIEPNDWAMYILDNYDVLYVFGHNQMLDEHFRYEHFKEFKNIYGHYFDNLRVGMLYDVTMDSYGNLKLVSVGE